MARKRAPSAGQREALREKGQFWTPDWVAEAMVAYVVRPDTDFVFDPAVGAGAFFRAAKKIAGLKRQRIGLAGTEIHPSALEEARAAGLTELDLSDVQITDFVLRPPPGTFNAIVANPPYIRHHRVSAGTKRQLRTLATSLLGRPLDGRAGLHIYFLLRALQLLAVGGRLSFIMPTDTCEGVFAGQLWDWIAARYKLEAVLTFAPEATPFPGIDTNPVVFFISNDDPAPRLSWAKCREPGSQDLTAWVLSGFQRGQYRGLEVKERWLERALLGGLSRDVPYDHVARYVLGDFAKVVRGIATGANDFFFLTGARARELAIPEEFLVLAVGRTRDVPGEEIDDAAIARIDGKGRPTLLFSPDGRPIERFPPSVGRYLDEGMAAALPERPLIRSRRPWYRMEVRKPPPFLFAYLGRRNCRFISNRAGVVPLTGFLCVYPEHDTADFAERLWKVLKAPETTANLWLVGKTYGNGAIKVEPRALERLPLPEHLVAQAGISGRGSAKQGRLF